MKDRERENEGARDFFVFVTVKNKLRFCSPGAQAKLFSTYRSSANNTHI